MKISRKQALKDFQYLEKHIDNYLVDEEWLVTIVFRDITMGEDITITDILIGAIEDIIVQGMNGDSEDFLRTDKRALRIIDRYKGFFKGMDSSMIL